MRTVIALLLGAWLTGTVLIGAVAAENFFMVDRLLQSSTQPAFQKDVAQLGSAEARVVLRYLSSELNRYFFAAWGWAELVLGTAVVILAARSLQRKFVIGFSVMLFFAAVMLLYLVPEMNELGRAFDFVPRQPPPPGMARFGRLHGLYSALDLLKLLMGLWMAVALARLERAEER